jgi:hypothetical protein
MKPLPEILEEVRAMPKTSPDLRGEVFDFESAVVEADAVSMWRKGVLTI